MSDRDEWQPISADRVTINGYRYKTESPAWAGLDLTKAVERHYSIWGKDYHLDVPFWHPDDGPHPDPPEMRYRVRPRRVREHFERRGDMWGIAKGRPLPPPPKGDGE